MLKIGLNGCFDLLHDGHKALLAKAFSLAGYNGQVKVFLNSDISIARLKGPHRPVRTYVQRYLDVYAVYGTWIHYNPNKRCGMVVESFNTEAELKQKIWAFSPDFIIHGNDITDVSKITGYPIPILIVPRGKDGLGNDISTTKLVEAGR